MTEGERSQAVGRVMQISVRSAGEADWESVWAVCASCFPKDRLTRSEVKRFCIRSESDESKVFVVSDKTKSGERFLAVIVGSRWPRDKVIRISHLGTVPGYNGLEFATKLVKALGKWAVGIGYVKLHMNIQARDEALLQIAHKAGFLRTKKFTYDENEIPVDLWIKNLGVAA